ncbi:DUF349 domain-containing protein [Marinoscillum sp.]|uniref:DUF349 domain-containing protein n=1 Tax=Marinoscillum sp. TaxID=2024838 RepID=UPI003BA8C2E8
MEDKENKLPENLEDLQDGVQENPELTNEDKTPEDTGETGQSEPEETSESEVEEASGDQSDEGPVPEPEVKADPSEAPEARKEEVAEEQPGEKPEPAAEVSTSDDTEDEASEDDSNEEDEDHGDEDDKLLESLHFDNPTKDDLLAALKKVSGIEKMRVLDKALKEIKPPFDHIYEKEKEDALKNFVESGNDAADFVYKGDETDGQFFELYNQLRNKKQRFFSELEKSKDENLRKKNEILEKLRELVDGEESTASINALKALQEEWKKLGQVPGAHVKSLWANYNALIDRFYDNRSIYFELKELDRRKNLEGKLELCARAEELVNLENIKEAIVQLNELHEEFKHIGPIPKEDQEPVWQRFKAASDEIYAKRKEFFDELKHDLNENADKKQALGDEAAEFVSFNSDKISDWNKKTKQLLELQKKWEAIGGLPRDRARQINKHFWGNFKAFFANKNAFFKTLETQREENYNKKKELLEKAEALKNSEEWDQTANELKKLQNAWRDIGPVPEKYRNEVYQKFKAACDTFFERKRAQGSVQNKEFDQNLKKKEEICAMLEAYINSDTIELGQVYDLLEQYSEIGFVPRNAIKKIHDRYDDITNRLVSLEDLSDSQRAELETQIQLSKLKNSPHGGQKIQRKEGAIKRKLSSLESDIATWKTNLDFFADSKTADKLKADFNEKIEKATAEMEELKKQLQMLKQI